MDRDFYLDYLNISVKDIMSKRTKTDKISAFLSGREANKLYLILIVSRIHGSDDDQQSFL